MIENIVFLPKCCCDELSSISQFMNHVGHSFPVHRIQSLVNLVKQIEGGRITFLGINNVNDDNIANVNESAYLDGKDKCESN